MARKLTWTLILFVVFLVVMSVLAYNQLIPTDIKTLPFYDSIGHFFLFGLLGLIAHYTFERRRVPLFGRIVPLGPTLAISYAFIDESLQVFSDYRTFDLVDLFWGVMGILTFIAGAWFIRNSRVLNYTFFLTELLFFIKKELRAVVFPAVFFVILFSSNYIPLGNIYRYDFLFVTTVILQVFLVVFKFETKDEAKTIFLFHIIGLGLELYKTHPAIGSWSYPEAGYFKIAGVPLYSGFMYAAVGSYIACAWKVFKLQFSNLPLYRISLLLCFFIYLNFFTNHFFFDYRMFLFAAIFLVYYKTDVYFTPRKNQYRMPLIISFVLIGFFVWVAENIATFYGAWKYPGQIHAWEVVSLQKITSWFLLVIICFIVVAYLKHIKKGRDHSN